MYTAAGPLLVVKDSSSALLGYNNLQLGELAENVCFAAECIKPMHATSLILKMLMQIQYNLYIYIFDQIRF